MIAALLLLASPAPLAQLPIEPWCELEPVIAESSWIVVAEVTEARAIGEIGTRVELKRIDALHGKRPPASFSYLADRGRLVRVGERELVFLKPPARRGHHHRLAGRVAARDRQYEAKLAWLKKALELRAKPVEAQARAYLGWYESSLQGGLSWEFWRALSELERLQRKRPSETRQLLAAAALESALEELEEGPARKRLEALLSWRKQGTPQD